MKIQDLENCTGLDRATIRYYEKENLLSPDRKENGYRDYSEDNRQTLLKIKLLRQLGFSLEQIRAIQQGREDIGHALTKQINVLAAKKECLSQAHTVCCEMQQNSVAYHNLNASYYLRCLETPEESQKIPAKVFVEEITGEFHPIRRFIARTLDEVLISVGLFFFLIIVCRIGLLRFGEITINVLGYISLFVGVMLETVLIHWFGTTPGKWAMGIHLKSVNGGHLTFAQSRERAWEVFLHGNGLGIPIWRWRRMYCSFRDYQYNEMSWDSETELEFCVWNWRRGMATILVTAVCVGMAALTVIDGIKPKNRGDFLTVSEFIENFDQSMNWFIGDSNLILNQDGTWSDLSEAFGNVQILLGEEQHIRAPYKFETENGVLKRIVYDDTWNNVSLIPMIPNHCLMSVYAIVVPRSGVQAYKSATFVDEIEAEILKTILEGKNTGELQWQNTFVQWKIEYEHCRIVPGFLITSNDKAADSYYRLYFEIMIE